jgi:LDH2 family malate/lactate/ureidoglycolate dehydrogenase
MPDSDPVEILLPVAQLREFSARIFEHLKVPREDASLAAGVLAASDLRGIDSHGIARLPLYVEALSAGRINPRANLQVIRDKSSVATIDGDNGLGLVVGPKANQIAMEKAERFGSGWVSVCNSSHFGIAGYYPIEALKRDLIGWAMTNASRLVAPLWGGERMLGTNPVAIAFPGAEEPAVVIDLATSAASYGKVDLARRENLRVPFGWIIDKNGRATDNPNDLVDGGALLPLGSETATGGHKGYALAAMVDLLSGVLSGANWGPFVPPFALRQELPARSVGRGIGHFFGALQIDAFMDVDQFKRRIDDWIRTFRKTKPAPGGIAPLIPGDPERKVEQVRSKEGVPLRKSVADALQDLAERTGVALG